MHAGRMETFWLSTGALPDLSCHPQGEPTGSSSASQTAPGQRMGMGAAFNMAVGGSGASAADWDQEGRPSLMLCRSSVPEGTGGLPKGKDESSCVGKRSGRGPIGLPTVHSAENFPTATHNPSAELDLELAEAAADHGPKTGMPIHFNSSSLPQDACSDQVLIHLPASTSSAPKVQAQAMGQGRPGSDHGVMHAALPAPLRAFARSLGSPGQSGNITGWPSPPGGSASSLHSHASTESMRAEVACASHARPVRSSTGSLAFPAPKDRPARAQTSTQLELHEASLHAKCTSPLRGSSVMEGPYQCGGGSCSGASPPPATMTMDQVVRDILPTGKQGASRMRFLPAGGCWGVLPQ